MFMSMNISPERMPAWQELPESCASKAHSPKPGQEMGEFSPNGKSHINVQESVTKITNEDDFLRCNMLTTVCAKLNDH
jgi:hypothetical protein